MRATSILVNENGVVVKTQAMIPGYAYYLWWPLYATLFAYDAVQVKYGHGVWTFFITLFSSPKLRLTSYFASIYSCDTASMTRTTFSLSPSQTQDANNAITALYVYTVNQNPNVSREIGEMPAGWTGYDTTTNISAMVGVMSSSKLHSTPHRYNYEETRPYYSSFGGTISVSSACYAYDANGNVTDLVGTNGEFLAQYQFDPYGNTISKTGALADVNPFRFSTKYTDEETGLYYYGYRYYMPEIGRWVNRDPLGEIGGSDWFAVQRKRSDDEKFWMQRARNLEKELLEKVSTQGVLDMEIISHIAIMVRQQIEIERQLAGEQRPVQSSVPYVYLFVENTPINSTDFLGLSLLPEPCTAWSGSGFWCHRYCVTGSYDPKTGEWVVKTYIEFAPCCLVKK